MAAVLVTGVLKVAGGILALRLARPAARGPQRWAVLGGGWAATLALLGYGSVQLGLQAAVASGLVDPPAGADRDAMYWHLYLWSPWFIAWGVLLGLAVWRCQRDSTASAAAPA
jgi:hypothetical protein